MASRGSESAAVTLERWAPLLLTVLLMTGCALVLEPFLAAILFSVAIVMSSWPAHLWILRKTGGRRIPATVISCLLVMLVVLIPTALLMLSLRDAASWLIGLLEQWQKTGAPELPQWIAHLPLVGPEAQRGWQSLTNGGNAPDGLLAGLAEPARKLTVAIGRALGNGLLQVLVAAVLLYFLFRDGDVIARRSRALLRLVGGDYSKGLLLRAQQTVTGIMFSVLGAALAQAALATIGFSVARVPNAFLLGALTFALSIVPVGPPLIWGGAAIWLYEEGRTGWAIFMTLYGLFGISAIDNLLKPLLISRTSRLPFAITLIGVIGGAIAFGVAGVILGPILLALAREVLKHRLDEGGAAA